MSRRAASRRPCRASNGLQALPTLALLTTTLITPVLVRRSTMGSLSRSESGTLSEDYSHYSGYSHGSVPSTLADLLERFTVEAQPDCTLKLRSACVRGPAAGIQALTGLWDDRSRPMGARCTMLPAAAAAAPPPPTTPAAWPIMLAVRGRWCWVPTSHASWPPRPTLRHWW